MWSTLVSGLFGGVSGLISPLIKGWEDRKNAQLQLEIEKQRHSMELEKLTKETELQTQLAQIQLEGQKEASLQARYMADVNLEQIRVKSEEEMSKSNDQLRIEAYKTFFSGDQKIDRIIAMVRPCLTGAFVLVFLIATGYLIIKGIKIANIQSMDDLIKFSEFVPYVALTDFTAGIMSFWFANRTITKYKK